MTGRTPRQTLTTTGKTALPHSRDFVITERPFTRLWLSLSPLHREKQGKLPQNIPIRENTGNLKMLPETQGILFAQVINSLILKVKNIAAKKIFFFFSKEICQICFVFVIVTYHVDRHRENSRLDRENTGNL